jgi:hypothetical protein
MVWFDGLDHPLGRQLVVDGYDARIVSCAARAPNAEGSPEAFCSAETLVSEAVVADGVHQHHAARQLTVGHTVKLAAAHVDERALG